MRSKESTTWLPAPPGPLLPLECTPGPHSDWKGHLGATEAGGGAGASAHSQQTALLAPTSHHTAPDALSKAS